jgi:RND family efflux transporter MFP subunit
MVLLGMVSGCNRPSAAPPEQGGAAPKTPDVKVVRPEKRDVRRPIERPGYNIEPYESTPLYAKIPGYVQKWNFDIGDRVHKGDVLAELYIPEMDVELRQKDASVGQATAEIKQADAGVVHARANLVRAKSQYERLASLTGVLDKDQVEEYRLGLEAAQAALVKAEADVDVAKARHKRAEADRDYVQTLLQYTKIPAPFDGVITRRNVSTRDFVQPANGSKGDALFVVDMVDPVRVFVNVQEMETVWVRDGQTAVFEPQSLPGQQFKGTVTRSSGALNPQNRTLRTEIDMPNPVGPDGERKLQSGMYGKVTIIAEHKNVWALPATAVVTKGDQTFCYRVENGKAVRTPIQIGLRGNESDNEIVEVVKKQSKSAKTGEEVTWESLNGEEDFIVTGAGTLNDGQPVTLASQSK